MNKPRIGFAGMTHLGINSAAATAARGFPTLWFDPDGPKITALKKGELPVMEPGLKEAIADHSERIVYSSSAADLGDCTVVYIACDVPTDNHGGSDLSSVRTLINTVCCHLSDDTVLVVLCQVPPGFTRALPRASERLYYQVETLVFGRAMERALNPERFIIGCADPARPLPPSYHELLSAFNCPLLPMRYESAELAKIAINCCLVASVTVANTLAELSEHIGANWHEIAPALKLDRRIGTHAYLTPGLGLSGGNLERDLATVLQLASDTGSEAGLIASFVANSHHRKDWVLRTLHRKVLNVLSTATLGILGLAYKENTHSTKNSPALALIRHLEPWQLKIYDPVVPVVAAQHARAIGCDSALAAAVDVDALVIMTPWPEFRDLKAVELSQVMKGRTIIDPYRLLDEPSLREAGFDYLSLGASALRGGSSLSGVRHA